MLSKCVAILKKLNLGFQKVDELFKDKASLNDIISSWDVSDVTSMANMFNGADAFNQNIGNWADMSSVTNENSMFKDAEAFNQDISNWDVSSVNNMSAMFARSTPKKKPRKRLTYKAFENCWRSGRNEI
mgnify:CR=1 FL=1